MKVPEINLHKNKFSFCLRMSYVTKLMSSRMISLDYLQFILKPQIKRNVSETV